MISFTVFGLNSHISIAQFIKRRMPVLGSFGESTPDISPRFLECGFACPGYRP